ncbi:MAG: class I SAM-dependent methyltransferase, partial [Actinobacteria bacterium]|nr:class I SAM-dependent methyltransferase [Actinomycetota bacterium]
DPRVERRVIHSLGDARTVVNVGAGAGAYEPSDRAVVAVEPATVMLRQRPSGSAPVVQAVAEDLPFADAQFDAAMASLTIHHWPDWRAGIREMRRVARQRIVLFHFDLAHQDRFWLVEHYLPEALALPAPSVEEIQAALGLRLRAEVVPVPSDCTDGFLCAYWARPEAYLDLDVRAAISTFHLLPDEVTTRAITALASDLDIGAWDARYGDLREQGELDLGYRLLVADL